MSADWIPAPDLDSLLAPLSVAVIGMPDATGHTPITLPGVGSNCAASFQNEVFAIRDYCWCEGSYHRETVPEDDPRWESAIETSGGESTGCPPNFEHFASGLKVVWYKHMGRSQSANQHLVAEQRQSILAECLASIETPFDRSIRAARASRSS